MAVTSLRGYPHFWLTGSKFRDFHNPSVSVICYSNSQILLTISYYSFIIEDTDQEEPNEEIHKAGSGRRREGGYRASVPSFCGIWAHHYPSSPSRKLLCPQIILGGALRRHNWSNQLTSISRSPPLPRGRAGLKFQSSNHMVALSGNQPPSWSNPTASCLINITKTYQQEIGRWGLNSARSQEQRSNKFSIISHNIVQFL